jgi:hypothetical protein
MKAQRRITRAQKDGLRYEREVQTMLQTLFPEVELSTWWSFLDCGQFRLCQTDAVLFTPHLTTIFEVKRRHTPDAWWQLHELYRPVLQSFRPGRPINLVEICGSFDPLIVVPAEMDRVECLQEWVSRPQDSVGVVTWTP